MGQRINIQYSVDIDDLYGEVERILQGAHSTLDAVTGDSADLVISARPEGVLSLDALGRIDMIRQKLAAIDFTLRDASTIISAYVSYKAAPLAQSIAAAAEEPDEVAP